MRRTSPGDLLAPFAIIGITVYVLLRFSYGSIPPVSGVVPIPLGALAVIEFVLAQRVRAAVRHDPRARLMTAIAIARCVALGKASSLVAAGVGGAAVGLLLRVAPDASRGGAASSDTKVAVFLLVVAAALVAAGLWLERAGVDPSQRGGSRDQDGSGRRAG
jgi:hypothetical protein